VAGVALPWLVLGAGGSHAQAGFVFSATIVPYLVFGLPAGAAGDRRSPRALMLTSHAAQALCAAVIPLWTIAGTPPVAVVLALAFAIGSGRVFADSATFGAVASIVGPERFTEGQTALSAAWGLGLFAGPALGGALVAAVGPGYALAAEAGACTAAALCVVAIRTPLRRGEVAGEASSLAAIAEGLRFIVRERGIATYTLVICASNLAGAGAYALLVPLLRDRVGLPAGRVGAILAAGELCALAVAPFVGPLSRRFGAARLISGTLVASALTIAGLGLATGFAAACAVGVPFLMMQALISILVIGERQRRAPVELQSRVGSAGRMAVLGAVAAGSALASAATGALGLKDVYLAMAAASLAVALVAAPFILRLR
jgi:MFS family permease